MLLVPAERFTELAEVANLASSPHKWAHEPVPFRYLECMDGLARLVRIHLVRL
jgi:hypothetical protein